MGRSSHSSVSSQILFIYLFIYLFVSNTYAGWPSASGWFEWESLPRTVNNVFVYTF